MLYLFWLETRLTACSDHTHPFGFAQDRPNLPSSRAVRGSFFYQHQWANAANPYHYWASLLSKGSALNSPSCINLRGSNPVRGEMFIEIGTTEHIYNSVGVTREIAVRNTYRTYGAWLLNGVSYAINISLLTEFRT